MKRESRFVSRVQRPFEPHTFSSAPHASLLGKKAHRVDLTKGNPPHKVKMIHFSTLIVIERLDSQPLHKLKYTIPAEEKKGKGTASTCTPLEKRLGIRKVGSCKAMLSVPVKVAVQISHPHRCKSSIMPRQTLYVLPIRLCLISWLTSTKKMLLI